RVRHRNVYASANDEIPGIVARSQAPALGTRQRLAGLHEIGVSIGVCAPEERFHKWLEMSGAELENRPHVVGEEVTAARRKHATRRARSICMWRYNWRRKSEGLSGSGICIKFCFDANQMFEEKRSTPAAAVQGKATQNAVVLWVEPHVRVVH